MANTTNLEYQLADIVAKHYDIGRPVEVHTLQATRNHTLAIVTDGGRYAVRVRGDAWWIGAESELEFELDLLDHLARDGLTVSTAVRQRDGSRVGIVDDGTQRRTYSLFTWVPGRPGARTPGEAYLVGQTLARIHLSADTFTSRHRRYELNEATMLDRQLPGIEAGLAAESPANATPIRAHIDVIRHRLRHFDPGPSGGG